MGKESIQFHIESDDYFGTLATILSLINQAPQQKKENKIKLESLIEDLMYLNEEYIIIKKLNNQLH